MPRSRKAPTRARAPGGDAPPRVAAVPIFGRTACAAREPAFGAGEIVPARRPRRDETTALSAAARPWLARRSPGRSAALRGTAQMRRRFCLAAAEPAREFAFAATVQCLRLRRRDPVATGRRSTAGSSAAAVRATAPCSVCAPQGQRVLVLLAPVRRRPARSARRAPRRTRPAPARHRAPACATPAATALHRAGRHAACRRRAQPRLRPGSTPT